MKISDLLLQYQQNLASGSEITTSSKGVERLVETVKQLQVGYIFEGTVNSIKGTSVILGLSSGHNITARLDKGVEIEKGQSVFFQVKANDGEQIQIKPISLGNPGGNPTLMEALDAANLPVNQRNLNMVNAMMKEQMPIHAKSLQEMSRQLVSYQVAEPNTLVEMVKLKIPVTQENINQFQNYKQHQGQIMEQIQQLSAGVFEAVTEEGVPLTEGVGLQKEVLSFFLQEFDGKQMAKATPVLQQNGLPLQQIEGKETGFYQIQDVLTEVEKKEVGEALFKLPGFAEKHANLFANENVLHPEEKVTDILSKVSEYMEKNVAQLSREEVAALTGKKSFQKMVAHLMKEIWSIEPEKITEKDGINQLYEKMDKQLEQLQKLVMRFPNGKETVLQATNNLRQNIEFMHQINQWYSYVQIPLRFSRQHVNGELFVYRHKKEQTSQQEALSAFLHFDMEHLGGMDISVKLSQRDVDMKWYLDREDAYTFLEENMHLLQEKLKAMGYGCSISLEQSGEPMDFVEDLLKADIKGTSKLQRYSFDVRA